MDLAFFFLFVLSLFSGMVAFGRLYLTKEWNKFSNVWGDTPHHKALIMHIRIFNDFVLYVEIAFLVIGVLSLIYATVSTKIIIYLVAFLYIGTFAFLVSYKKICPISDKKIDEFLTMYNEERAIESMPPITQWEHERRQRELEQAFEVKKGEEDFQI